MQNSNFKIQSLAGNSQRGFELLTMRLRDQCAIHSAILTLTIWSQNIWIIYVLQFPTVSVAQLPTPYPTPNSKSPYQGLSESVVGFSGTFHFTRLDSGEQCVVWWLALWTHNREIRGSDLSAYTNKKIFFKKLLIRWKPSANSSSYFLLSFIFLLSFFFLSLWRDIFFFAYSLPLLLISQRS